MIGELFRWLRLRWRGLFARGGHEAAMDREMQFHLDMLVQESIAAGMSPEEAKAAAQREFGGQAQYREECRDTWRPSIVSGLAGDLAYAARALRRSPGFTAVAVFTLALGIGVNVVMFSFVRDSVLRPILRDHDLNLVSLYNVRAGAERHFRHFSYPEYNAMRESNEVFADVAALGLHAAAVGPEDNLQRRFIGLTSQNFFSLLGVQPAAGRFFTAEESQPGAAIPVVVANYALWERLGRPDNFIGSTLRIEDGNYTVIGMTPPGFVGLHVSIGPEAWVPFGVARLLMGADLPKPTDTRLGLVARLQPGLSLGSALARLEPAERRLNALPPVDQQGARKLEIAPPSRSDVVTVSPDTEAPLALFGGLALGLSLMVLLVACLNLANMLLARGIARHKEIAIRLALGASRWRVVRGLLAEGLLLGLLGGALSVALGQWCNDVIIHWSNRAFAAGKFALQVTPFVDGTLVLAALGFSLLATLGFSLWPALRITRAELYPDLKQVAGGPPVAARGNKWFSLGDVPLVVQIALSLALLFSAALFVRAASNVRTHDLGFRTAGHLTAQLDYKLGKVESAQMPLRQQALLASTLTLSGVTATALSSNVPYNFDLSNRTVRAVAGDAVETDPKKLNKRAGYTAVTRGYFGVMGITLLSGRDFSPEESDGSSGQGVAVIDDSLARVLFGEANPLGRRLMVNPNASGEGPAIEVIGVVRSPRNDVFDNSAPRRIYRPLGQAPESNVYLHVQVAEPLALVDTLRAHLKAVAPEVPVLLLQPFADFVDKNINVLLVQLAGGMFGAFGGIALVLAAVGVYGVKAHATARRTREIGVRVALGARPLDVMLLILKQGVIQAGVGLVAGIGLALGAGVGMSAMLYRVSPYDLAALSGSAALLGGAVLLACWLPARRAMKVDPLVAIRTE